MTIIPQDATPMKRCPKCLDPEENHWHPATLDYFHSSKNTKDGLHGWCKQCRTTYNKVPSEKNRETQRKYDKVHTEEKKQYRRQYYKTDACKATYRNVRARRRGAKGKHTAQDVQKQYTLQKGKCYYCSVKLDKVYHVDHIIPLSRGGSNDPSNLVIACPHCNRSKNDKLLHEWPEGGRLF